MTEKNPKIIHRIYFTNFSPFRDPYEKFLQSWYREMPDYKIMLWGKDNLDVEENEWTRLAAVEKQPVFLSEYFRWKVLAEHGGIYIDADCEIVDGRVLNGLIDELYNQDDYDVFFGVEERENGYPTAQTFAGKRNAELVSYMRDLYANRLSPLWPWRETRGLIGPQLISSYFLNKKANVSSGGHFVNLKQPVICERAKVYPQQYFSPKFTILGNGLEYKKGQTCVYHMFANANVDFSKSPKLQEARNRALTFDEYRAEVTESLAFPRVYDASRFNLGCAALKFGKLAVTGQGPVSYGPYASFSTGQYSASWYLSDLPGGAFVKLSVTADLGKKVLASVECYLSGEEIISVPFEVSKKTAKNVEFVLEAYNAIGAKLERVIVDKSHSSPIKVSTPGSLKILHRVYFGFDGKPDQLHAYLRTWQKQLPDFKIMHWNADNLPMDINPYVRQLYKEKDHAFLTDYFRWYLLREYGGSYLDADVEIVNGKIYRRLIEDLEQSKAFDSFIGIDEKGGGWYTAHSMASKPNSEISRFMCEIYENFGSFTRWRKQSFYLWAPQLVALYFANRGHNVASMGTTPHLSEPTVKAGVKIYPQDWFSPLAPTGRRDEPFLLNGLSDNTALCHHFACSWHDDDSFYAKHSKEKGGQANILLNDIIGVPYNRLFSFERGHLKSLVGNYHEGYAITAGEGGYLSYGPYVSLEPGQYRARFEIHEVVFLKDIIIDVVAEGDSTILAPTVIDEGNLVDGAIEVDFDVIEAASGIEVRVMVGPDAVIALKSLSIVDRDVDDERRDNASSADIDMEPEAGS